MADPIQSLKRRLLRLSVTHQILALVRNRKRTSFRRVGGIFRDRHGLEIGGPSPVFGRAGPFPLYAELAGLDNVNFSEDNFWSDIKGGRNFVFDDRKQPGKQIIADTIELSAVDSASYDVLLSSHSIEHVANPLKALAEWRRVIRPGGHIVVVAPDMRFTYDRNRPVTTIEHLIQDFHDDVAESDPTHFEEIIALHDLANDGTATTLDAHIERTRDNAKNRMAHHHVFDLDLLVRLLETAGFETVMTDVFRPYHLLVVARNPGSQPADARPKFERI